MKTVEIAAPGGCRRAWHVARIALFLLVLPALPGARRLAAQGTAGPLAATLPPCQAPGQVVSADISTGAGVAPSTPDPRWYLAAVPPAQAGTFPAYAIAPSAAWLTPPATTAWLQRLQGAAPLVDQGGYYTYRLQLNLNPALYSNLHIAGFYAADNTAAVRLNSGVQATCTSGQCFQVPQPLTVTTAFVNGPNQLDVTVRNFSNVTGMLMAAKVEGTCLACVTPPAGMVAWYPLDEQTGATAINDIAPPPDSLVNNVGTPLPGPVGPFGPNAGPHPVPGLVGQRALYFYGPHIQVPPQSELDFGAGDFSADAWIRAVGCGPGRLSPIVDKLDTGSGTGYALYLDQSPPGAAFLNLHVNGTTYASTGTLAATAYPIQNSGPWYHIAVTVHRATVATFYINGAAAGTFVPPLGSVTNAVPMLIGELHTPGARCEIAIDELELFNRALSAAEVQSIYAAGAYGKCPPAAAGPADLGDAPDTVNHAGTAMLAYTTPPTTAHYSTVHDALLPPWRGPKHLAAKSAVWLGPDVSFEDEADTGIDQDGVNNLNPAAPAADQDTRDDGVAPSAVLLPSCGSTQLGFTLSATANAPPATYYVNAWLDFTRDGDWDDGFRCAMGPAIDAHGQEWAVQNMTVTVPSQLAQGGFAPFTTPPFVAMTQGSAPLWMRVTVSEQPVIAADNGGPFTSLADLGRAGSAGTSYSSGYASGETEDYLVAQRPIELCGRKWNDVNGDGMQQGNEPGLAGWQIEAADAAGNLVATAVTDALGNYCLIVPAPGPNVAPMVYTLSETLQAGWVQTYPSTPGSHAVTVNGGPPLTISPAGPYNFGNHGIAHLACDLGVRVSASPAPMIVGQQGLLTLVASNHGGGACAGITTLTHHLPAGLPVHGIAAGGAWQCGASGDPAIVTCTWDGDAAPAPAGPLPAVEVTVDVSGAPGRHQESCATVANAGDGNAANDTACVAVATAARLARQVRRQPCAGSDVTVGNGSTTTEKYPFNGSWDFSWANVIYLASEIGRGGTISQIAFSVASAPSLYTMTDQLIYVRHTTATGLDSAAYPGTTGFTQVFNGTITYSEAGWKAVTLDPPFVYDGVSNLDLLFESRDGSYQNTGFPRFFYTGGYPVDRVRRDFADALFPDSCVQCAAFPNVLDTRFHFCGEAP